MALVVCCPCGLPLDCENIDLVVEASCPKCDRQLDLEIELEGGGRRRAVLTIMEGPIWVGEQFVMPINEQLTIGSGTGGWLSLESDDVAEKHCQLRISSKGYLIIEDLDSKTGTWVEGARISKGKIRPHESFRVGEYRFRLDFRSAVGGAVTETSFEEDDYLVPVGEAKRLQQSDSPIDRLIQNRFQLARKGLMLFAWLAGIYHCLLFRFHEDRPMEWYFAMIGGAIVFTILYVSANFVRLLHRHLRFLPIGILVALAIYDIAAWNSPVACIASLVLAGGLTLSIGNNPRPTTAVFAGLIVIAAEILILAPAVGRAAPLLQIQ